MQTVVLFKQIESLPESIQAQLADYVAFLVERYGGSPDAEPEWTAIDDEIAAFEADPKSAIAEETVNNSIRMRHADRQNPL